MQGVIDRRLVYLLNVGQRRLHRWTQAQAATSGVTAAQAGLLFYLGKHDGALMGEAAAALDLGASALSGLVDRMTTAGLVERRADATDGRAWQLWLTEAGRAALALSGEILSQLNARLGEGFSAEDMDVVARWLGSLQDKFPATGDD